MSPDTILTSTQEQALALIAAGSTATAAAASAGIHRNTISNWLRGSPAFSQALACVHFDRALYWREQAESLAPGPWIPFAPSWRMSRLPPPCARICAARIDAQSCPSAPTRHRAK
jgi:hypothetical protein